MEVPASGIYSAQLMEDSSFRIDEWYPWSSDHFKYWAGHHFHTTFQLESVETNAKPFLRDLCVSDEKICSNVEKLCRLLAEAVEIRIRLSNVACQACVNASQCMSCVHARIGVLFSGGLDSTIVAVLADKWVLFLSIFVSFATYFEWKSLKTDVWINFPTPYLFINFFAECGDRVWRKKFLSTRHCGPVHWHELNKLNEPINSWTKTLFTCK